MYIQITDHCNMRCAHCAFSCSPKKKRFMTLETFEKAIDFIGEDHIDIGGGEPTLHPQFWAFIGYALGSCESIWLATNGSQTETTIKLARMARRGVIACDLSVDFYHDQIDGRAREAFSKLGSSENDMRAIRDVSYTVKKRGRATKTGVWAEEGCACDGVMVDPDGDIFTCGCRRLKIGNVHTGYNEAGERYKDIMDDGWIWDGITVDSCLFSNTENRAKYRAFVKWLKGEIV